MAFIFLTCHAKFEYAQEAIRLGCVDYILSPAPYETIVASVRKTVATAREIREKETLRMYGSQWLREKQGRAEAEQGTSLTAVEVVEKIKLHVLDNLASSELSVTRLATENFLNENYLSRVFKRETGVSLSQYIASKRMELAVRLLENEKLSVASVAAQVGYSNVSYFVTAFKKRFSLPPVQYREKRLKNLR
jgi:YesN/AraC family two-component response regulator